MKATEIFKKIDEIVELEINNQSLKNIKVNCPQINALRKSKIIINDELIKIKKKEILLLLIK